MTGDAGGLPELVDTHCHLDARQFAPEEVADIVARAAAVGVARIVTVGTDAASSARAVALAARFPMVFATVGVDPNDAADFDNDVEAAVADLATKSDVVAIGEIGLDYHWDRAPRDVQANVFTCQLELARAAALPVVIHSRDAHEDTARLLEDWSRGHPWVGDRPLGVMHCFSGDVEHARHLIAAGFLISLAGNVTFPKAEALQSVARAVPLDAMVLETDAPWLTPVPHRGGRNEPARVADIARFVAELRGDSTEAVASATTANASRLFGWAS